MFYVVRSIIIVVLALLSPLTALSQPVPGDVFREYYWYNISGDAGQALRVGGEYDYGGHNISLKHDFDLEHAVRAEVIVEKILCHDSTRGLAIQINDNEWIDIPEAENIPYPQYNYQHHIYPVVEVPLSYLNSGTENSFRMEVSSIHSWNWPQNLINGVHFRIYYDAQEKQHPTGSMVSPSAGDSLDDLVTVKAEGQSPQGDISKIEYIGLYTDLNFEGDGIYYQWHYHYYHGKMMNHIGSSIAAPFEVEWDTSWVPDQETPIQVAARIQDETGMIYMTEAVTGLELAREGISVELCRPYDVSPAWVTRKSGKRESFDVAGDKGKIVAARLAWSSWSPGYMNGIYINNIKVFDKEGPTYRYYAHRIDIDSLYVFNQGENKLHTGLTPLVNGQMVHGMEVNWPGIMVLLRYDEDVQTSIDSETDRQIFPAPIESFSTYPNPFNGAATLQYSLTEPSPVTCSIFSLSGQLVKIVSDTFHDPGIWTYTWDGRNENGAKVGSGVYISLLDTGGYRCTRKLVHLR